LAAIGLSPEAINALVASRRKVPIGEQQLPELLQSVGAAMAPLRVGGKLYLFYAGDGRASASKTGNCRP
jgi:hypothetical protein